MARWLVNRQTTRPIVAQSKAHEPRHHRGGSAADQTTKNVSKMATLLAPLNLYRDSIALVGANWELSYRLIYIVALSQIIFSSIHVLTVYYWRHHSHGLRLWSWRQRGQSRSRASHRSARRLLRWKIAPCYRTHCTKSSPVLTEANPTRTIQTDQPCTNCATETVAMVDWSDVKRPGCIRNWSNFNIFNTLRICRALWDKRCLNTR